MNLAIIIAALGRWVCIGAIVWMILPYADAWVMAWIGGAQ